MKERYYRFYEFTVVFSVTIAIAAQAYYDKNITKIKFLENNVEIAVILGIFSSIGIFYLLFTLLRLSYKSFLWKIINKRYFLAGTWSGTVTKEQGTPKKLFGDLIIRQSYDEIYITASHYKDESKTKLWSQWNSTRVFLNNGKIEVIWEVNRKNGIDATGKIYFNLEGEKSPEKLVGLFRDHIPSDSMGEMNYIKINSKNGK